MVTGKIVSLQVYCACSASPLLEAYVIPSRRRWPPYAIIVWLCGETFVCDTLAVVSSMTDSDGFSSRIENVLISLFPSSRSQR